MCLSHAFSIRHTRAYTHVNARTHTHNRTHTRFRKDHMKKNTHVLTNTTYTNTYTCMHAHTMRTKTHMRSTHEARVSCHQAAELFYNQNIWTSVSLVPVPPYTHKHTQTCNTYNTQAVQPHITNTCACKNTHTLHMISISVTFACFFFYWLFKKNTLKEENKQQLEELMAHKMKTTNRKRGREGEAEKSKWKKTLASSNMGFLNQPLAQRAFQKREINIDNMKAILFVFSLCSGGRIGSAGDSFDRPPRLSTRAHVKSSQLWLRSRHTITNRGTKGNSKRKKKKSVCKLVRS